MKILSYALLLLLILSQPASADPITAIITAIGTAFKAGLTVKAIATFALRTLVSAGISMLVQKFKKRKQRQPGIQTSATTTGGTDPQGTVVGRFATAGHLIYQNSHGENRVYLTHVIELGDIPGANLRRLVIDGEYSDIGTEWDPNVGYQLLSKVSEGWGYGWIRFYDGSQLAADSRLVELYGEDPDRPWTSDHILTGLNYAVLTFYRSDKIYPSGRPQVRFELDGPGFYDPRQDSTAGGDGTQRWSDPSTWQPSENLMVIAYTVMRGITLPCGSVWGGGFPAEDLPYAEWAAAMDACDLGVGGGNRPQFRGGMEVRFEEAPADFLEEVFASANAEIVELGGFWYPMVGSVDTYAAELTEGDLLVSEGWKSDPFPGLEKAYNAVTITHPSPNALWNPSAPITLTRPAWEAEDGGQRVFDLKLPMVYNAQQARQLGNALLKENRRFRSHRLPLPPEFARLRPLLKLRLTSEWYGYTAKTFTITEMAFDLLTLNVSVSLREWDHNDFDPDLSLEIPDAPQVTAPIVTQDAGVPGFGVTGVEITDANGVVRGVGIRAVWNTSLAATTDGLSFQARVKDGDGERFDASTTDLEHGTFRLEPMQSNTQYEARVKPISKSRTTQWTAWVPVTTPAFHIQRDELDELVTNEIEAAQAAADQAAADALQALADAGAVQGDFDALTLGYTGSTLQQSLVDLLDDAGAYTDSREVVLQSSIDNTRAMDLPSDFAQDGLYWQSTSGGAPGQNVIDSRWKFYTSSSGWRFAYLTNADYSGNVVWLTTRGTFTPRIGRRYKLTMRCVLWGSPSAGPHFSLFFRTLNGNYDYVGVTGFTDFSRSQSAYEEFSIEVECDSSNVNEHWRAGMYVRGNDFTGGDNFQITKLLVEDITETAEINANLQENYYTAVDTDNAIAVREAIMQAQVNAAQADATQALATGATNTSAIAVQETLLRASLGRGGLQDGLSTEEFWVGGWDQDDDERATAQTPSERYPSFAHHQGNLEGGYLRLTNDYRVLSERYLRPMVDGQKWRVTLRCRWRILPTTPQLRIWITGSRFGVYQGYSTVQTYYSSFNDTSFVDLTFEITPSVTGLSTSLQCDKWGLMIGPMYGSGTTDGEFELSAVTIEDATVTSTLDAQITDIKQVDVDALTGTALGALLTQLDVDAGGISATILAQGGAIADLEGNASAGYLIQAQAGGEVSLLQLVAADGISGPVSVAKLAASDILLDGSVATKQLAVTDFSGNLWTNGDFREGDFRGYQEADIATVTGAGWEIVARDENSSVGCEQDAPATHILKIPTSSTRYDLDHDTKIVGVRTGDSITISADLAEWGASAAADARIMIEVAGRQADGTWNGEGHYTEFTADQGNDWVRKTNTWTATKDHAHLSLRIRRNGSTDQRNIAVTNIEIIRRRKGTTMITPKGVTAELMAADSVNAKEVVVEGSITAQLFEAGAVNTEILTITDYLDMDANETGMRIGKQSIADASDGAYFGRTDIDGSSGFGFYISRYAGGQEQHIKMTEQDGLEITNAVFKVGAGTADRTTYTSTTTYNIPAGTTSVSLAVIGGGGGGGGGGAIDGGAATLGGNGSDSVIVLKDGTTTIKTWTASGGAGGGVAPGSPASPYAPYGSGGAGGRGSPGNSDSNPGDDALPGVAGSVKSANKYDVSGLSNPKLEITIGGGGAGGSGYENGSPGGAGFAEVTVHGDATVDAGPISRIQTANGTVSLTTGNDTQLPSFNSPGLWQVWGGPANLVIQIDNEGSGGTTTLVGGEGTFPSARNRPKVLSSPGNATLHYRFWPMG